MSFDGSVGPIRYPAHESIPLAVCMAIIGIEVSEHRRGEFLRACEILNSTDFPADKVPDMLKMLEDKVELLADNTCGKVRELAPILRDSIERLRALPAEEETPA